jgi:hypothetical protein
MPNKKSKNSKKSKRSKKSPLNKAVNLTNNASPRPVVPRKQRVGKPSGRVVQPRHVMGVCTLTDPFCPAAKNAKWTDGTCGNTLTEQFRGNVSLSSSANGTALICFAPGAPFGYNNATAGPSSATFAATYTTYKTTSLLATYGGDFRIVSFGIIARTTASATNASGVVTFGTTTAATVSSIVGYGTELYDEVAVKAIQPGMEFSWISQPRGSDARAFLPQTAATPASTIDWTSLFVEVVGAGASLPLLNFEWFLNIEFLPIPQSAITALAKPNPPKSTHAETAVSHVHSSLGSFIEGGVKHVEEAVAKSATTALNSIMDDPLGSLAALFAAF